MPDLFGGYTVLVVAIVLSVVLFLLGRRSVKRAAKRIFDINKTLKGYSTP